MSAFEPQSLLRRLLHVADGRRLARLAVFAVVTLSLGGCESLGNLAWWNKEEQAFDEPADKLYNEGLFLLNDKKDIMPPPSASTKSSASIRIPSGRASRC